MAAIPTILHLGNDSINGTRPRATTNPLSGTAYLFERNYYRYLWAIPADPSTGALASPVTYKPWWDIGYNGFAPYYHAAGSLSAPWNTLLGDNTSSGGTGFGSSVAYMQRFADLYAASPYFKAIKLPYPGRFTNQWKSGGSSYLSFETVWDAAVAEAALTSDTLDAKLIILDASGYTDGDIANWGTALATYQTDLTNLIAAIRTKVGSSDNLVVLITHAPSTLLTSSVVGSLGTISIHLELCRTLENVSMLQMKDADLGTSSNSYGVIVPGSNRYDYTQEAILDQGEEIYAMYVRWLNGQAPTSRGNVIPWYLHIGDSQGVGNMSAVFITQLNSPTLQGPRTLEYIYNGVTNQLELFNPGANSNTCGNVSTNTGSILTLTEKLKQKHPNGYILVHMAKSGSAISGSGIAAYSSTASGRWAKWAGENYPVLQQHIANALDKALTQTGSVQIQKVPVLNAIFTELGDNDTYNTLSGSIFSGELKRLIRDLRQDFGSVIYGIETPVIMVRPHIDSALGDVSARNVVRTAFTTAKRELENVDFIDIDDLEFGSDTIHYGASTAMTIGYRLYDKYAAVLETLIPAP